MKVLNLLCSLDHTFEGWFASEGDFHSQQARGLVQCPMCGDSQVRKGVSAPRLNLSTGASTSREAAATAPAPVPPEGVSAAFQATWLAVARRVMAQTEDVGDRFASEARRMHYGETEERGIRGQATPQETAELLDEGIAVLPLVLPQAAKEPLH